MNHDKGFSRWRWHDMLSFFRLKDFVISSGGETRKPLPICQKNRLKGQRASTEQGKKRKKKKNSNFIFWHTKPKMTLFFSCPQSNFVRKTNHETIIANCIKLRSEWIHPFFQIISKTYFERNDPLQNRFPVGVSAKRSGSNATCGGLLEELMVSKAPAQ